MGVPWVCSCAIRENRDTVRSGVDMGIRLEQILNCVAQPCLIAGGIQRVFVLGYGANPLAYT